MGLLLWRKRKKISTICLGFRVGSTRFALMRKILKNEEELRACAQCTAGEPSGVTKGDPETKLLSCPYLTGIITISNDVRCSQKRELQNAVMK